jgi:hypothetical protein
MRVAKAIEGTIELQRKVEEVFREKFLKTNNIHKV